MTVKILLSIGKGIYTILGWAGSIAYLLGYLLLTMKKLKPDSKTYHVLNVAGAVGLTINAIFLQDFPNIAVNVAWGVIAVVAILSVIRRKQS
jgi:hypothetical protein